MPVSPSLPYRVGLRLGAIFDRAMEYYAFRLAISLGYKAAILWFVVNFLAGPLGNGLKWLGLVTPLAFAVAGVLVVWAMAHFPDGPIWRMLVGWPRRQRR